MTGDTCDTYFDICVGRYEGKSYFNSIYSSILISASVSRGNTEIIHNHQDVLDSLVLIQETPAYPQFLVEY